MPLTVLVALIGGLLPPFGASPTLAPEPAWHAALPHLVGHPLPDLFVPAAVRVIRVSEDDDDDDWDGDDLIVSTALRPGHRPPPLRPGSGRTLGSRQPTSDRSPILRC